MEIFPSEWDLAVVADGHRCWAIDCWCLRPGCSCQEIAVDFLADGDSNAQSPRAGDRGADGNAIGVAWIDVGRWNITNVANDQSGRLADRIVADPALRRELRTRRTAVRSVARALPRFLEGRGIRPASCSPSGPVAAEEEALSPSVHAAEILAIDSRRASAIVPKVGRNMPCPCGSGKKYKRCCGA